MGLKALVSSRGNVQDADWLHLTEGERVRWSGRPSRYTIVLAVASGVFFAIVGIAGTAVLMELLDGQDLPSWVGYLPLVVTGLGVLIAGMAYLRWVRLLYVITDEEIYVKYGLISRGVTQVRLDRVQNTAYDQSVLERVLSFGDIRVYTAGTSMEDITFRDVPNPVRVKSTLTRLLDEQRPQSDDPQMIDGPLQETGNEQLRTR